jgi:uncharacterized membrane protein
MNERWLFALTLVAALGSALIAGVFFAFSTFVMKALGRIPPAQGIAAMQSINIVVINPAFMAAFLGTAVDSVVLAGTGLLARNLPGSGYLIAGALLYVIGVFLVTMLFNVPRNNALAAVDPASAEGSRLWTDYLVTWTAWNHVRTLAALGAAAAFIMALVSFPGAAHLFPSVSAQSREQPAFSSVSELVVLHVVVKDRKGGLCIGAAG